jgi:tetrapyrrole methylase family protein / MazG family protein
LVVKFMEVDLEGFSKLIQLMETLRSEKGCPWDRKQTTKAFKTFLLEEVYELIDAIENDDSKALKEELGDLLFHIVFMSQICKERGLFDIGDVVGFIYEKMYRRHPHVFSDSPPSDRPIETRWEDIKKQEKGDYSLLSNIPDIIPALLRAYIISRRVARVGFDWEKIDDVYEKVFEEIDELRKAETSGNVDAIKEEIGDLLFTIVNIARFHNIDPEDALRFTSNKFIRRFSYIETKTDIENSSLSAMDQLWNEIKDIEKKGV